jgi:hypothetical protein
MKRESEESEDQESESLDPRIFWQEGEQKQ